MRLLVAISLFCILSNSSFAQYFLRGNVVNEKDEPVANVKIQLFSKGKSIFYNGNSGGFGLAAGLLMDTIYLSADGYESLKQSINTNRYQKLVLKALSNAQVTKHKNLSSKTKDLFETERNSVYAGGETYNSLVENHFVKTNAYPQTGFSLNINRASYSNIRRFLNMKNKVPPDAVRIEEMLNYFNFTNTNSTQQFTCETNIASCPWSNNKLLYINLQAPKINLQTLPASNLVFLIDVSGSMDQDNRLPLLQTAFKLLTDNLRAQDSVTIIVYGGATGIWLHSTSGAEKIKIKDAIERLAASGATPGEAGIQLAYNMAKKSFIPNGNNRVILATDGDFNVGLTSEKELEDLIVKNRQSGVYLTCVGVGMGNYKDSKLETLVKKGNGNFAYIDNLKEAEKVFITEFTKTVYAVANDAYLTATFNKNTVKEYRIIGFDNNKDAVADSGSELEGGEIGTGHTVMAVFELNLQDSNAVDLGEIKLQYKKPGEAKEFIQVYPVKYNKQSIAATQSEYGFAAAVIMLGSMLKQSEFCKPYGWQEVINYTKNNIDMNNPLHMEFLSLVEQARYIYEPKDKKRKKD